MRGDSPGIHQDASSAWEAPSPVLPGCVSAGPVHASGMFALSFQAAFPVGNPARATRSCHTEEASKTALGVPRDAKVVHLTSF